MRAGKLRHYIDIEARVVTQDAVTGAAVETYATKYDLVPAEFVFLSGKEFLSSQQVRSEVRARITIRSGLGIEPTDRVAYQGKHYNIEAILPDPTFARHDTLMVSEGVQQ